MFTRNYIYKILKEEKISLISFILFILILTYLSIWQLNRHYEKTNYINNIANNLQYDSIDYNSIKNEEAFSKIKLEGNIDYSNYFWLYRRHPLAKNIDGAYLVVPVSTNNKKSLVILGWFSSDNKDKILKELTEKNNISLEGILLESEKISVFLPKNDINKRVLFTLNIDQISHELKTILGNYFIAAINLNKNIDTPFIPITSGMMINIKNDHLGYCATWFGLALVLCCIYYIYIKKKLSKWKQ